MYSLVLFGSESHVQFPSPAQWLLAELSGFWADSLEVGMTRVRRGWAKVMVEEGPEFIAWLSGRQGVAKQDDHPGEGDLAPATHGNRH